MSTFAKSTQLLLFPLVLLLLSSMNAVSAAALPSVPHAGNIESSQNGTTWLRASTAAAGTFDMVGLVTEADNEGVSTQYWVLYKCDNGQLEARVRIARSPKDPSVDSNETQVLNGALARKRGAIITLTVHNNGSTCLKTVAENVNTVPCVLP